MTTMKRDFYLADELWCRIENNNNFLSTYEQTKVVKPRNIMKIDVLERWKTNHKLADQVRGVHGIECLVREFILHRHEFEESHNENFYVTNISTSQHLNTNQ